MEVDKIVEIVKAKILELDQDKNETKKIPIEASGRHVHISESDAEKLFGKVYTLKKLKDLSQPGQYACEERVRVVGPKGVIDGVIILGPYRGKTQVELSITDARILGVKPTLRESGDIDGTPGILIMSGEKFIRIEEGVIVAKNHIHMTFADSKKFNVRDKELVKVQIKNTRRPLIFQDVLVRVNDNFKLNMHIDYDEANCCMLSKDSYGEIIW